MSLDTKYRPSTYADVLGQEATIEVLRQFVIQGRGFHQSVLFAGAHGCGKTSLARIYARALLCDKPTDRGEACDKCSSCQSILEFGSSETLTEVDAATNSGKDDVKKITEEIQYASFSGRRRLYIFDECFTEDTVLLTPEGPRSIRALVESKYEGVVLSFDTSEMQVVWKHVTAWFDLGEREVITLEFDNGVSLTVTLDQKVFTRNRGWVGASDLTFEDDIVETSLALHP